jgi:hypothetical protein
LWEVCLPDLVTPVTRRSRKPPGRIVGKPLNCHSRANSRETGMWEMPNRCTSGIVGGSDITFRRHRRVLINLSVRLASSV